MSSMKTRLRNKEHVYIEQKQNIPYLIIMIRKLIHNNNVNCYSTLINNGYIKYISSESWLLYGNVDLHAIHHVSRHGVCQI